MRIAAKLLIVLVLAASVGGCFFWDECRSSCDCWYARAYQSCGGVVP